MIVDDLFEAGGPRIPGFTNPVTGKDWSRDELLARKPIKTKPAKLAAPAPSPATIIAQTRKQKQQAAAAAAQAQMVPASLPPSAAQTRQQKQAAAAATAQAQMAGIKPVAPQPTPLSFARKPLAYSKVKMNAPGFGGLPRMGAPVVPGVKPTPLAQKEPSVPKMTPAEYIKKIGAPALPESIVNNVTKMLESVKSKKDVTMIREYIDTNLSQSYQQEFRRVLHEKVTVAAALRRRIAAQQAAQ